MAGHERHEPVKLFPDRRNTIAIFTKGTGLFFCECFPGGCRIYHCDARLSLNDVWTLLYDSLKKSLLHGNSLRICPTRIRFDMTIPPQEVKSVRVANHNRDSALKVWRSGSIYEGVAYGATRHKVRRAASPKPVLLDDLETELKSRDQRRMVVLQRAEAVPKFLQNTLFR